jgi:hypothetical protein
MGLAVIASLCALINYSTSLATGDIDYVYLPIGFYIIYPIFLCLPLPILEYSLLQL